MLVEVGQFEASDFGQLFDRTFDLPWSRWLSARSAFPVNGRSVKSRLSSVPACQRIVKKAVVESLRKAHRTTRLEETGPRTVIEVSLLEDRASITLDTTGVGLHKRSYRLLTSEAPLRETLAAALVMLSFWNPERPLIDPFCGSGTIVIEAAMIGRRIAPGLRRVFDAEGWHGSDRALWERVRARAAETMEAALPEKILGSDLDGSVLGLARYHAERAEVAGDIHFQQRDFADLSSRRSYGCIITNPPYGLRMGSRKEVDDLYRMMPAVLRRLPTWSHYIFSGRKDLEALLGRKADRRRKLYNAQIECTYYQFHGPKPGRGMDAAGERDGEATAGDGPTQAEPAFDGLDAEGRRQVEEFANRLAKTARHLRRWPARRGIGCYRVYDRDIPGIGLTVDRYEDRLLVIEHPHGSPRSAASRDAWLDGMAAAAAKVLQCAPSRVVVRAAGAAVSSLHTPAAGRPFVVGEAGLRFEVRLDGAEDAGLALDRREIRAFIREEARGKDVLALFDRTGAISVCAASAKAASVTAAVPSAEDRTWFLRNLALNGLEGAVGLVPEEGTAWLAATPPRPAYDLAVVDPAGTGGPPPDLLIRLWEWMRPGGRIYVTTAAGGADLPVEVPAGASVREITARTIPEDFRDATVHRCWVVSKAS